MLKEPFRTILLAPLSALYGIAITVRHILYDEHLLPSFEPVLPTICVGNLMVGGTGKTPLVEYLVRLLSPHFRVAIVSRGYGRKTHGFILADGHATAETIGDEPMQLHTKFPDIPVVVSRDRISGIKRLKQQCPDVDVVILDDAFQHRRIRCGLTILLTPFYRLYTRDHLLPWGRLRDIKTRSQKADIVVVSKCPADLLPIDRRIVGNELTLASFQLLCFSQMTPEPLPQTGTPLVLTGIAEPAPMLQHVRQFAPQAGHLAFPDHYVFRPTDISQIMEQASRYDYVLTTEKDAARLCQTELPQLLGDQLRTTAITMDFGEDKETFNRRVMTYVQESVRKKHKK